VKAYSEDITPTIGNLIDDAVTQPLQLLRHKLSYHYRGPLFKWSWQLVEKEARRQLLPMRQCRETLFRLQQCCGVPTHSFFVEGKEEE